MELLTTVSELRRNLDVYLRKVASGVILFIVSKDREYVLISVERYRELEEK